MHLHSYTCVYTYAHACMYVYTYTWSDPPLLYRFPSPNPIVGEKYSRITDNHYGYVFIIYVYVRVNVCILYFIYGNIFLANFWIRWCVRTYIKYKIWNVRWIVYEVHIRNRCSLFADIFCPIPFRSLFLHQSRKTRRLLCDYLKTYFFYNDNGNNDNKLMRSEETFY